MPPTLEQPEVTMDTAQATLDRAKAMSGSVSANQLAQPAPVAPVTEPAEAPPVDRGVIDRAAQGTQDFITAQSAEADRLKQLRDEYGAISGEGTLSDMFTQEQNRMGIPQNLRDLQDIQLQLADRGTSSQLTQAQIAGKAGQTINEAGRAITQEQRESAIRDAGLAARAQVLQGNIETASTLVNQAVQLAYQDRTLRNTNLINQINDLRGVVDEQTQQLLDKEQRKYEEDQAQIMRAQDAVDSATVSGYASPEDIKRLTELSGDPQAQAAYARGIVAQGAIDQRRLSDMAQRSSIAASAASRRKSLIEMGMMGDPTAIAELGFDPGAEVRAAAEAEQSEIAAQTRIAADKEVERLDDVLEDITDILGNNSGLQSSTGQFRNATITGLTPFVGENYTEISGGLPGLVSARQSKDDWLAKVGNILTEEGFASLIDINERVRLTPITQMEVSLAFQAASQLQTAARYKGSMDEGNRRLVGFALSEEETRKAFSDMYLATEKIQEEVKGIEQYGYDGYVRLMELEAQATE
jgi:hypothetical protein